MPYLVKHLWKLPDFAHMPSDDGPTEADSRGDNGLLAAACRDCGQYTFPPTDRCRTCHSPRVQIVSLSEGDPPHPGRVVFGNDTDDKPN